MKKTLQNIIAMYREGFRSMTVGRSLWTIIIIKVIILFAVIKLFFMPDKLATEYDNDSDRARAVRTALSQPALDSTDDEPTIN
ncbi:MAG: DUF4492 domain-containing protein [Bacteroidales bacterium]|nr:DUF4492 domain-containing protein [Bacteroidales bacterium]